MTAETCRSRRETPLRASVWLLAAVLAVGAVACGSRTPVGHKVIVLGFDGLDYDLTRQMIASGRLPGFARLAETGGFAPLGTTNPPQ